MKKTRFLSILLSVVLVLGCVPMMAVSADELTDLDVSTVLSVDSSYTGTIDETDPYVDTNYWGGYAKGFTVAGNFFELLKSIDDMANEVHFGIPGGFTVFGAPDVLISEMSVAGK